MKIERAIEILDPEHRECYDGMDEVNEACRMGPAFFRQPLAARNPPCPFQRLHAQITPTHTFFLDRKPVPYCV